MLESWCREDLNIHAFQTLSISRLIMGLERAHREVGQEQNFKELLRNFVKLVRDDSEGLAPLADAGVLVPLTDAGIVNAPLENAITHEDGNESGLDDLLSLVSDDEDEKPLQQPSRESNADAAGPAVEEEKVPTPEESLFTFAESLHPVLRKEMIHLYSLLGRDTKMTKSIDEAVNYFGNPPEESLANMISELPLVMAIRQDAMGWLTEQIKFNKFLERFQEHIQTMRSTRSDLVGFKSMLTTGAGVSSHEQVERWMQKSWSNLMAARIAEVWEEVASITVELNTETQAQLNTLRATSKDVADLIIDILAQLWWDTIDAMTKEDYLTETFDEAVATCIRAVDAIWEDLPAIAKQFDKIGTDGSKLVVSMKARSWTKSVLDTTGMARRLLQGLVHVCETVGGDFEGQPPLQVVELGSSSSS